MRTRFLRSIGIIGALFFAAAVSRAQVTVGTATAAPGQRAYGEIRVPAGVDTATSMPVAVVVGTRPGPRLAITSGAHGTEYASIVAAMRVIDRIDPSQLRGSVVVLPLINRASFERMRVHTNPVDEKGMNSSYPGNPSGTQTERALAMIARQVLDPADIVLDLHNGDIDEDLRPYSYWLRTGVAEQDAATKRMAVAFGLDHIIVRDVDIANPAQIRSASGYTLARGKRSIVAEAGRAGLVTDDDVASLVNGLLNVMAAVEMLPKPVTPPASRIAWMGEGQRARADSTGVWFPSAHRDQVVKKGDVLGVITDFFGRKMQTVVSPLDGKITFIRPVPSLWPGATIANVGELYTEPPPFRKP